jgi:hypothetical protein
MEEVEKVVQVFNSFEEAETAEIEADLRRPCEERINLLLELQERMYPDAAQQGFARVYRVTQREQS